MTPKKKLIEVALPLDAINAASAREKSIRHGHPSTLHLWWARRPLAACRALLFASLVDDPSSRPDLYSTVEEEEKKRQELFRLIEELVKWENSNDERVLKAARREILLSTDGNLPSVYDPFCGGGSIPLEAQRLGLEAHASDLNPVSVLITKALIELPPKYAGRPPMNPEAQNASVLGSAARGSKGVLTKKQVVDLSTWKGAAGLAEDIRYYGRCMSAEAQKLVGNLYPKLHVVRTVNGTYRRATPQEEDENKVQEVTVIAWLWARTVASPNPAAKGAHVPLVRSFKLCTKPKRKCWLDPVVNANDMTYRFDIRTGEGEARAATVSRNGGICLLTGSPMPLDYIRSEGRAGRMGARLMAIVVEGPNCRAYLPATQADEALAYSANPHGVPDTDLPTGKLGFRVQNYGMVKHRQLFTSRQLAALTSFQKVIPSVREEARRGCEKQFPSKAEADAYVDAIITYLGLTVSKLANRLSALCFWDPGGEKIQQVFARQAITINWDFVEGNPFSDSSGNFLGQLDYTLEVLRQQSFSTPGYVQQHDAAQAFEHSANAVFSTDPPYYDNVPYSDLSDFFYVWLRPILRDIYPELFSSMLTPKVAELVADSFRHGGAEQAQSFFEKGFRNAFLNMRQTMSEDYPLTVFYAFKQAEVGAEENDGNNEVSQNQASTGWETMLEGLFHAGFSIDGTWPIRTELTGNLKRNWNALASSIVIVCRPRPQDARIASRSEFLRVLRGELPEALRQLQKGNIAPVDLAQAAIGPGMAVYTRFAKVLDAQGKPLSVRQALALINQTLDEVLAEQEGDFDSDSRWALAWFEQSGFGDGAFGVAETLSKAKNTSVDGMVEAGILASKGGKVRLLKPSELSPDWDPDIDLRFTVWESVHHLVRALEAGGENAAAQLVANIGSKAEIARELAYRLYTVCERKKRSQEALSYNGLVQSWPEITRLARQSGKPRQSQLFDQE
jgi:putative DNA methylase